MPIDCTPLACFAQAARPLQAVIVLHAVLQQPAGRLAVQRLPEARGTLHLVQACALEDKPGKVAVCL